MSARLPVSLPTTRRPKPELVLAAPKLAQLPLLEAAERPSVVRVELRANRPCRVAKVAKARTWQVPGAWVPAGNRR